MKKLYFLLALIVFAFKPVYAQQEVVNIYTSDIDNFWAAYDKIATTKDSAQKYTYINKLFIEKGTPGLKAIMKAKGYTDKSYLDAIHNYPLFWNSVRPNTLKAKEFAGEINAAVLKLKKLYPEMKPASIYFTVGALRTGGTTIDSMVLIGSEISFADKNTISSEFPKEYDNLKVFFKTDPINAIVFTNVHEYVHTQEKTTDANTLLGQSILEGVAEFVAVKATGQPSTAPAMAYGKANYDKVGQKFAAQMFNPFTGFWLYSNEANEFGLRDLGYYVGYAICEGYLEKAKNKQQAIKDMIELDYNDDTALEKFADASGYFNKPVSILRKQFEESRPTVTGLHFNKNEKPDLTQITIAFSTIMDKRHRNFELGPLGKDNLLMVKRFIGFSEDGKSATFEVEAKPAHHYQLIIGSRFSSADGLSLKPYLIDFKTEAQ